MLNWAGILDALAPWGMAAFLAGLGLLYLLAGPPVRAGRRAWNDAARRIKDMPQDDAAGMPSLALIVPLTGDAPGMRASLESLLLQVGLAYDAYFVVAEESDPAAALTRSLMKRHPRVRLVVAGLATTCCQKNHSLLAGIAAAGEPELLAFCDSNHEAMPDFLVQLATPVARGNAVLATTHRRVLPAEGLTDVCYFYCALVIQMLQALPPLCQPWGGATVIRRSDFLAHGVDAVWARGVVDDFTMGPYLQDRGVRAVAVPEAALLTRLRPQSWASWWSWWFRQLLYLKLCMPGTWLAASLATLLLGAALLWAAWDAAHLGWAGLAIAAGLAALGALFGSLCQRTLPLWQRCLGFPLMLAATVPCLLSTWLTNSLRWRGITYVSGLDGRVRRIVRKTDAATRKAS